MIDPIFNPIFTDAVECELVEHQASDLAVVNAARISFDMEHGFLDAADEKLIPYLMREHHGSPFEHGMFKFRVQAPIFCFREHHRHRVGHSYNEMSGRYTELEAKFYVPKTGRVQAGKPCAYTYVELDETDPRNDLLKGTLHIAYAQAWRHYQNLLEWGFAKEQARMVLPVGIFSKMIWTCNPRSLMHFLSLRNAPQAQKEIRLVAEQAEKALAAHMPHTYKAFNDYGRVAP